MQHKVVRTAQRGRSIQCPVLLIHGDTDEAVPLSAAYALQENIAGSHVEVIKGGTHTFSISHPWEKNELSPQMEEVFQKSLDFIREH